MGASEITHQRQRQEDYGRFLRQQRQHKTGERGEFAIPYVEKTCGKQESSGE